MVISLEKKVLIVESHSMLARMLESCFDSLGVKAFVAISGAGALRKAEQGRPDLILLDTSLSDMDGATLVAQIRENWKTSRIPVIAVSGFSFMRAKYLDSGCNVFIPKPFTVDELVFGITGLLAKTVIEESSGFLHGAY